MFRCAQCDKSYQRKAHLQRHVVTRKHNESPSPLRPLTIDLDTGQATTACPFCRKCFLKPYALPVLGSVIEL